ncbi:MAG TPA: SDR family oxidoreductase [Solirubrobacteraceae bacterium]|nr:SDR family oxidoreductase [Solirubrobacteraceae bacterium]
MLVTGASAGLGLETAVHLAGQGFRVFAAVRNLQARDDVLRAASARGATVDVVRLDLTDRASIDDAVAHVLTTAGGIFALVNNAGIGLRGCLEDCSEDEIRLLFDTNVLGTIAVTKAVVPHMRTAGCGRIVTVSSVGGRVPGFGVTMYCTTKFAQEGLGEGLAQELAPFGIQSVLVEPGIIKTTRWSRHRGTAAGASDPASPYHDLFWASEAIADKIVDRSPTRPEDVARTIATAITASEPRMRYVVGRGASIVIALRRYMPQSMFERLYFGGHIRRLQRRTTTPSSSGPVEVAP